MNKTIPPLPAQGQGIKYPNLERNTYIAVFVALAIITIAAIKFILQ